MLLGQMQRIFLIAFLTNMATLCLAEEWQLSHGAQIDTGLNVDEKGQFVKEEAKLTLQQSFAYAYKYSFHLEPVIQVLRLENINDRRSDITVDWQRLTATWSASQFNLELGRKKIIWGEALGPSLVDIVQPKDWRDPRQLFLSEERLAQDVVHMQLYSDWLQTSVILVPQARRPRYFQLDHLNPIEESNYYYEEPEGGLKLSRLFDNGLDLKLFAYRHHRRSPVLKFDPFNAILKPFDQLMHSVGAFGSYANEQNVFRFEMIEERQAKAETLAPGQPLLGSVYDKARRAMFSFERNQSVFNLDIGVGWQGHQQNCKDSFIVAAELQCEGWRQLVDGQIRKNTDQLGDYRLFFSRSLLDEESVMFMEWEKTIGNAQILEISLQYSSLGLNELLQLPARTVAVSWQLNL